MTRNTTHSTLAVLAREFTEAWARHDIETAATYLDDDVTFEGPTSHSQGKAAYIEGLRAFAPAVTGLKILAAFGEDAQALIMYELTTESFGTLTAAELLTFTAGKIQADRLTFDTYGVRQATVGQPPADASAEPAA